MDILQYMYLNLNVRINHSVLMAYSLKAAFSVIVIKLSIYLSHAGALFQSYNILSHYVTVPS